MHGVGDEFREGVWIRSIRGTFFRERHEVVHGGAVVLWPESVGGGEPTLADDDADSDSSSTEEEVPLPLAYDEADSDTSSTEEEVPLPAAEREAAES